MRGEADSGRGLLGEALLYDLHACPECAIVRACLQLAGVSYRRVPLGRQAGRRRGDLAPVLVTADGGVAGAAAIVARLEAARPSPPLRPDEARARIWCGLLEQWAHDSLGAAVGALIWGDADAGERLADGVTAELAPRGLRVLERRRVLRAARDRYRVADRALAAANVQARVELLAALLGEQPFLLGARPTLADVTAYVHVVRLRLLPQASAPPSPSVLARWLARLDALPAIATAVSP